MHVFYHDDPDGLLSAAIINHCYADTKIHFHRVIYGDTFNFSSISSNELVYVVDFSFSDKDWHTLLSITENVFWIDHHITAIQNAPSDVSNLAGIRSIDNAACLLTWQYLFLSAPPKVVVYVADYDAWHHQFFPDSTYLHEAIVARDYAPDSSEWQRLFGENNVRECYDLIEAGTAIVMYQEAQVRKQSRHFIPVTCKGLSGILLNTPNKGNKQFGDAFHDSDFVCVFHLNSRGKIDCSFYSAKEDVDCSAFALELGGGGHKGAAGAANVTPSKFFEFFNLKID